MPTYEYRCKECGNELEIVQSFTDDALTTCEACGGPLRKVFGNVGIAFKGSGFYKTDSRGSSSKSSTASSGSTSSSDSGSSDSGSGATTSKSTESSGSSSGGSSGSSASKEAATA